jgi:hypothetical protein
LGCSRAASRSILIFGAPKRGLAALGELDAMFAAFAAALADQAFGARVLPDRESRAGAAPGLHDILAAARPRSDPPQELDHDQTWFGLHVMMLEVRSAG